MGCVASALPEARLLNVQRMSPMTAFESVPVALAPIRFELVATDSAHQAGGSSGSILAWFDLDATAANSWDPVSGALSMTSRP